MPKLSEIANVTRRGGGIPDVEDELEYSGYCLYEAVKAEMQRSGGFEVVDRGHVPGLEGKISVPTMLKFLWPDMFKDKHDADSDRVRKALYQFLRDTKNLICITPGSMREMSTWWARDEWNDDFTLPAKTEPARPEPARPEPAAPRRGEAVKIHEVAQGKPATAGEPLASPVPRTVFRSPAEAPCHYCGRSFVTQAHLTRHIYKEHEDFTEVILSALVTFTVPVQLADITRRMQSEFGYPGSAEAVRTRLAAMTGVAGSIVITTVDEAADRRQYSIAGDVSEERLDMTISAAVDAGLASAAFRCREPSCDSSFLGTTARRAHEDAVHFKSEWRTWECLVCAEDGVVTAFYNRLSWAMHTSAGHGVRNDSKAFQLLSRETARVSDLKLQKLRGESAATEPAEPAEPAEPQRQLPPAAGSPAVPSPSDVPVLSNGAASALTIAEVNDSVTRLHDSLAFIVTLAQSYAQVTAENESLRRRLAAGSTVRGDSDSSLDELQRANNELRRQVEALQRLMANLS